jgi:hypothetical protein
VCCVSVVQENWPLELVPKIGVGIMCVHVNKISLMYHTGKNGVKEGKTLTRIIHECRREAFEPEARRGFSQVRPTQAYLQSVEEAEREKPRWARGSGDVAGIHE